MKVCTQCKVEKENVEFPKRKISKDGLYSWCKICTRKKSNQRRLDNPERAKQIREKRKEQAYKRAKIYKKLNADKIKAQRKLFYQANRERLCAVSRKYGKNKTEEQKKERREYYKKWRDSGKAREYCKKTWKEKKIKFRKYYQSTQKVQDAIRSGKLIRPENCSICNIKGKIEGHHADYDKPLDVIWVCRPCHRMIHKQLKENKNGSS